MVERKGRNEGWESGGEKGYRVEGEDGNMRGVAGWVWQRGRAGRMRGVAEGGDGRMRGVAG